MENQNLRNAIEDLTITFEEFQSKMTQELFEKTQSLSALESKAMTTSALTCLEQAKYVESRLDATTALLTSVSTPLAESNETIPGDKYSSPRRAYHKPSLLGTPTARPLNWIVKQANTEVKLLRKRAEDLQWYIPPAKAIDEDGMEEDEMLIENKENNPVGNETQLSSGNSDASYNDLTQKYRTKLMNLKHQLEEAVNVICEQDRLIHAGTMIPFVVASFSHLSLPSPALVGNMSSYTIDRSNSNGLNYAEEDEGNGSDEELQFDGNDDLVTPMKRNQMNSSYDPSDWSAGFSELLPAGWF
jgi:hypothetical protein